MSKTNAARLCTGLILAAGLSACAASPGAAPAASTVAPPAAGTSGASVAAPPASTSTTPATTAAASVVVGKGAAVNTPSCTHSSCAHITATTTGFPAAVTCAVAGPDGGTFGVQWQQSANEKKESPNYYGFPGTTVTVTCTGDGRTASGSLTW